MFPAAMTDAKPLPGSPRAVSSFAGSPLAGMARSQISPAAVPVKRRNIALAIAVIADLIQAGAFPVFWEGAASPPDDVLDVIIAGTLILLLGFRWRLLMAFALELVPGVALFPSWTAVVFSLPVIPNETTKPKSIVLEPIHPELPEHK